MQAGSEATLLRIFIGNDDVFVDKPLYDELVLKARAMGMAGATVTRGILAYGPASAELGIVLRLSQDLPVVVEIVDSADKVASFLDAVDGMIESALVTTQPVWVMRYGRRAE